MTERAGRHAAGPSTDDRLLIEAELRPVELGSGEPAEYRGRPAGRHAAPGPGSADPGPTGNGHRSPQNGHGSIAGSEPAVDGAWTAGVPAGGLSTRPSRAAADRASQLRQIWVYPDLLSTYGDRGNMLVLQRRARLRAID